MIIQLSLPVGRALQPGNYSELVTRLGFFSNSAKKKNKQKKKKKKKTDDKIYGREIKTMFCPSLLHLESQHPSINRADPLVRLIMWSHIRVYTVWKFTNLLYTGRLFHCYMLDASICHFRDVGSILSLLFYQFLQKIS